MDAQELRRYSSGCDKDDSDSGTQETLGCTDTKKEEKGTEIRFYRVTTSADI